MATHSDTRARIIEAAERVLREKGLAHSTTKEIARAAGCSEGTLYNYFKSKEDLFLAVIHEGVPGSFIALTVALVDRAGQATVREHLVELANAALAFYWYTIPMGASLFAEPDLLARHREGVFERGGGPHKPYDALAAYLRAEQRLGRVSPDIDPHAAADLLLGACFSQVYMWLFIGEDIDAPAGERFVAGIVHTLMAALAPLREQPGPP